MAHLPRLHQILLRMFVGVYLAAGLWFVAGLVEMIAFRVWITINRPDDQWSDFRSVVPIVSVFATIPLVIAFGLWRRLKFVRLLLIVCSIGTLGMCAFAVGAIAAGHMDWVNARELGFREPPLHTLAIALGAAAFAGFQWWTLARREIRLSFEAGIDWRKKPTTETERDSDMSDDRIQSSEFRG